jgi:hypothetical protein
MTDKIQSNLRSALVEWTRHEVQGDIITTQLYTLMLEYCTTREVAEKRAEDLKGAMREGLHINDLLRVIILIIVIIVIIY